MKRPIVMTMIVSMLLLFQSGCSWIKWQKVPERDAPVETVECRLAPPIVDTVLTAGAAAASGLLFLLTQVPSEDVGSGCGDACLVGIGVGYAVVAAVFGAAAITGWVNYRKCREYQKIVTTSEQLGTGPEFVNPSPPSPQIPPSPESPPTNKPDGESK
jgi:hypothetical protein